MAHFLVSGASGFIGTWVVKQLLGEHHQVTALDLSPANELWSRVLDGQTSHFQFTATDLTCPAGLSELLIKNDIDYIIHLAALLTPACQQDPWRGFQTNLTGSTALFEAARRTGNIKAISYTSSYAVYGDGESAQDTPPMFYGAFKQSVDLIAQQYWLHEKIPSIAIRPHVVYGPERAVGLTAGPSLAARAAAHREPYCIGYTGIAGYDFVEDVARALVRGATQCPAAFTIADMHCQQATVEGLVEEIEAILPGSRELLSIAGPKLPASLPTQPSYVETIFPGFQATPLREGLRKTIHYYQDRNLGD